MKDQKIHVHYVPAYRDPAQQLKQTAGTIMHRLINAVEWSEQMGATVDEVAVQSEISSKKK